MCIIQDPMDVDNEYSEKYGKIVGYHQITERVLTVSDPDLIKRIFIKDFSHFVNRLVRVYFFDNEFIYIYINILLLFLFLRYCRISVSQFINILKINVLQPGQLVNKHSLLGKMMSTQRDERWKALRNTMTPAFTTGKMKHVSFVLYICCTDNCG